MHWSLRLPYIEETDRLQSCYEAHSAQRLHLHVGKNATFRTRLWKTVTDSNSRRRNEKHPLIPSYSSYSLPSSKWGQNQMIDAFEFVRTTHEIAIDWLIQWKKSTCHHFGFSHPPPRPQNTTIAVLLWKIWNVSRWQCTLSKLQSPFWNLIRLSLHGKTLEQGSAKTASKFMDARQMGLSTFSRVSTHSFLTFSFFFLPHNPPIF